MDKLRNYLLICICVTFPFGHELIYAQDWDMIDSLKNENLVETDSIKIVENYYKIATCFRYYDVDSSLKYSYKGLSISDKINYTHGAAKLYYNIAHTYYRTNQYKLSLENFNMAVPLFSTAKDSLYLMKCYNNLGALFSFGNNQPMSLEFHLKSLKIAEKLQDTLGLSNCYNNLGYLYQRIKEYKKAVDFFENTLLLDRLSGNKSYIALSHANLGYVYMTQNKKEEATKNYIAAINLFPSINDTLLLANLYLSASKFYFYTNQLDSAKLFIDKSQLICSSNDFPQLQADVYYSRGLYYMKRKMYRQSVIWFNKSLYLNTSNNFTEALSEIYLKKAEAHTHINEYQKAYNALRMANSSKDSLKYGDLAVMLREYEKEQEAQKELQRQHLEQELFNQKIENSNIKMKSKFQIALLSLALLGIILIVTIAFFLTNRRNNKILQDKNTLIQNQKDLLNENLTQLEKKRKKLQQLVATKDKFFSIIAHDLRSPFHSILGFSNMIEESIKNKEYANIEEYSSIIQQASQKTIDLIDNLIKWSRSQTNRIEFTPEFIELEKLINDIIELMNYPAQQKSINISLESSENICVFGDMSMIKTIIRNLISNAIKFTNQGGKIIVSAEKIQKECHISVSDNGVGMKKETLDKLFRIEENVSRSGTQNESGTGLGLILCKDFVEKHKGKIFVKSEPGVGSTFKIILPIKKDLC